MRSLLLLLPLVLAGVRSQEPGPRSQETLRELNTQRQARRKYHPQQEEPSGVQERQDRWDRHVHVLHMNDHQHEHNHSHAHLQDHAHLHNQSHLHVEEHDHVHEHSHHHKHNHLHGHDANHTHELEHEHVNKHKHHYAEDEHLHHDQHDHYKRRHFTGAPHSHGAEPEHEYSPSNTKHEYSSYRKKSAVSIPNKYKTGTNPHQAFEEYGRPGPPYYSQPLEEYRQRHVQPQYDSPGPGQGDLTDYQMKSVEKYIGDSGKEFEGAAEKIVESYMGEYMDKYMNEWYIQYCRDTGKYCDQIKEFQTTPSPAIQSPRPIRMEPKDAVVGSLYSALPSPVKTSSTPYPYFRESKEAQTYKPSSEFQHPSLSDPFFKEPRESNKNKYFPKRDFPDLVQTAQRDEHIKHFPRGEFRDFHPNEVKNNPMKENDFYTAKEPATKRPKIATFPKRKKKRVSKPTKAPNFFEKYLNAFKKIKLPILPGIRSPPKKGKSRKEKNRNKKKRPNLDSWADNDNFMHQDFDPSDDFFSGNPFDDISLYGGQGGMGFEEIQELPLDALEGSHFDYYS